MSMNGSGVFVVNSAGQPVVASTLITAAAFNAFTADVATALSTAVMKDGQQTITANIPFSGFKATGLGDGTAKQDAATLANVVAGTGIYISTVGGTADAITLTASPAITAYAAGQTFRFLASGANTTTVTVAISGLAAKAITKNGSTALAAGDIASGHMVTITYDGTRFILAATSMANITSPTLTTPTITTPTINGVIGGTAIILKRKTADETVTTSTVLQDDDHLLFAIGANEEYVGHFELSIGSALSASGVKIAMTFPSGATFLYSVLLTGDVMGKAQSSYDSSGGGFDFTAASLPGVFDVQVAGRIWVLNGATPGNVKLQWAQSTSSGSTVMKKGSFMVIHRVA